MNGIEPPSPMNIAGLPNAPNEASRSASPSHGASGGAFHPAAGSWNSSVTFAPNGGSSTASRSACCAAFGATVGGRRSDRFSVTCGNRTFPAFSSGGRPSCPVTAIVGRQVRFRMSSAALLPGAGPVLPAQGKRENMSSPRASAAARACSARSSGISAWSASGTMRSVSGCSIRSRSFRSTRNGGGTTPPASPEWTPSVSTSARSVPPTMPRSEVVDHNCS